jgi:hypothetical protein
MRKLIREDLLLPSRDELTKLVQDFGMNSLELMNHKELVFDYPKIDEKVKARLEESFYYITWKGQKKEHFIYYDNLKDLESIISKFNETIINPEDDKEFKKLLSKTKEERIELLRSCVYLLQCKWHYRDRDKEIENLMLKNKIYLLTDFKDLRKIKLKNLSNATRKIESSLIEHFIQIKLPKEYQTKFEEDQKLKVNEIFASFKKYRFSMELLKTHFGLLFVRYWHIMKLSVVGYSLKEFLEISPIMGALESNNNIVDLLDKLDLIGLKAEHLLEVYYLILSAFSEAYG